MSKVLVLLPRNQYQSLLLEESFEVAQLDYYSSVSREQQIIAMCYFSRYLETAPNSRWQVWRARRVEDELEERVESQLEGAIHGRLKVMMMTIIMLALMMMVMMMLMVGVSSIGETVSISRESSMASSIIIVIIFLLSLKIFNLTGAFILLMITNQGIFCSGLERDPAKSNITGIFASLKTF